MKISKEKREQFFRLFQEFIASYPYTSEGLSNLKDYKKQRQQIWRNFATIIMSTETEIDITEKIRLKFFLNLEMEVKPVINFLRNCIQNPVKLSTEVEKISGFPKFEQLDTERLSLILNTFCPDEFLRINHETLVGVNYFADKGYNQQIKEYPAVNDTGIKLIQELSQEMHKSGVPALGENDLFNLFCSWSKNKKYLTNPEYSLSKITVNTGFSEAELTAWLRSLERKKQIIFAGSPGTGKTYIAQNLAKYLIGGSYGFTQLIQFHPAYSYEDFIQGIRPQTRPDGNLNYPMIPGVFLEFCQKAEFCEDICVLIIDEINRANLAQVFGELMYLLEYREEKIPLAGSRELFSIPQNVRIIGTMNTSDRSIALIDHAFRRRFAVIQIPPKYETLQQYHQKHTGFPVDNLIKILKKINKTIDDPHYFLGISFFLTPLIEFELEGIWRMEIEPYLAEYFFAQPEQLEQFRWEKIKDKLNENS